MSETVSLPLEVVYHIIGSLEGDLTALRQCALTNSALLACARENLYHDITLTGWVKKARLLGRTLRENMTIGAHVKYLKISRLVDPSSSTSCRPGLTAVDVHLTPEILPFCRLPNLRGLAMKWVQLHRADDVLKIAAVLPRLESLACETLIEDGSILLHTPFGGPDMLISRLDEGLNRLSIADVARFPKLKQLIVKHGSWNHNALAKRLLLHHRGSIDGLEKIDVSFGNTPDALAWVPVILTAAARMQSVRISMADRSSRPTEQEEWPEAHLEQHVNDHAYILDSIAHCSELRSLCLVYHPDPFAFGHVPRSQELLETLCETLERRPAPLSLLEHIELRMVDREGRTPSISPALCTRLAHSLLDKKRYPRFGCLAVGVQQLFWALQVQMWSAQPGRGTADFEEEVLKRWRDAFSAFDGVSGVILDVHLLHSGRRS
ncbi:hypothetical protein C8Q79DRAFT_187431 [Trametes meyenii]|nr:hypothetical protein C8Q79DRAFT_187431 [Trametes meyenii]